MFFTFGFCVARVVLSRTYLPIWQRVQNINWFFFKMESQWIPNLKPAALVELSSSNRIGQQNDCLKKPRWTWKCSCSLLIFSLVVKGIALDAVTGGLLGFLLSDWICQLVHLFVMYLYWVSASYAFSWDVSLEKVWTQRKKTNNSENKTKTKRYQEVQDGYSSG